MYVNRFGVMYWRALSLDVIAKQVLVTKLKSNPNTTDVLQLPAEDEVLLQKLREESRAVFLQRKSRELLDNEELQVINLIVRN